MGHHLQILSVTIGYLVFLILWGLYQGRKVKTSSDYAIAGRALPGWAASLSERATGESSWALLGLPGIAYATGLVEIWTAVGCVVGIITAWVAIAWRLRNEAEKYRIDSFTDYLAKRHSELGKAIRITASLTIVFFFFFYVGAQFLGGGKTLFTMFGIDPKIGMLLTALIIVPYTIYGGLQSVIYTDVVQSILMITTLIVGPIVGIIYIANHPGLFAQSIPQALAKAGSSYGSLTGAASGFAAGVVILSGFAWFFGYLGGQPQLSIRFMATKNTREINRGRNIGIAWTVFAYIGALSLGWIGLAIFGPGGLEDQEYVMPAVLLKIFPPAVAGLLITGAIAAMISTADSLLILSSTELSQNLLKPIDKDKDENGKKTLRRSRIVTGLLASVALGLSYITPSKLIFTIVSYVWAGIGCTFSVVILLTLCWKRFHGKAVLVTIITGMVFTVVWSVTGMEAKLTSRIATFVAAGLAAVISTYLLPKSPSNSKT